MKTNTAAITEVTEQGVGQGRNKKIIQPRGDMKRNRSNMETSKAFRQRGGVIKEIHTVKPKNVQNEKDKGEKEFRALALQG